MLTESLFDFILKLTFDSSLLITETTRLALAAILALLWSEVLDAADDFEHFVERETLLRVEGIELRSSSSEQTKAIRSFRSRKASRKLWFAASKWLFCSNYCSSLSKVSYFARWAFAKSSILPSGFPRSCSKEAISAPSAKMDWIHVTCLEQALWVAKKSLSNNWWRNSFILAVGATDSCRVNFPSWIRDRVSCWVGGYFTEIRLLVAFRFFGVVHGRRIQKGNFTWFHDEDVDIIFQRVRFASLRVEFLL